MLKLAWWQKFWCYMGLPTRVETIGELIYNYPSPELLDIYAKRFFKYTPDGGPQDELYKLKEAWERFGNGIGNDCEEYARIFWEVLRNKYNCFQAWVFPTTGDGHAVCVYEENGRWKHISNWGISRGSFPDLKSLWTSVYPNAARAYMIEMRQNDLYNKIQIFPT